MEEINIGNLPYTDFIISDIVILEQYWEENEIYRTDVPRAKSGFLYFCGSCGEYFCGKKTMQVNEGSIVYLPPGTEYSTRFYRVRPDRPASIVINLYISDADNNRLTLSRDIVKMCDKASAPIEELINSSGFLYSSPVTSFAAVKRNIYALIEQLASWNEENNLPKKEFVRIKNGIEYLESDAQQQLSISEIAELCGVSETYFRRLFFKYAHMSPNKFRLTKKIEKAKLYLDDGSYSVSEISEYLGFEDQSYFSRIFKKYTGVSPHKYRKGI